MGIREKLSNASRVEIIMLGLVLAFALCVWGFVEIADLVQGSETPGFDEAVVSIFRSPSDPTDPIGSMGVEDISGQISAVGSNTVIIMITVLVAAFLLFQGRKGEASLIVAATLGSLGLSFLLKLAYSRPRPDLSSSVAHVTTSAFPSGHAVVSIAAYLTMGALLAYFDSRTWAKVYYIMTAILVNLLIAISRLHLGTHWPTDIIAGWAVGTGWAILCWMVAYMLYRRDRLPSLSPTS